jgi:hypothetical protein
VKFVSNNLLKIGGAKAVHFIEDHPGLYNTVLKWIHRLGLYEQARAFYRRVTRHNQGVHSTDVSSPVITTEQFLTDVDLNLFVKAIKTYSKTVDVAEKMYEEVV